MTINKTSTGLQSIILHDSYFKGKRTKINCVGHTNNTGDNGMGKTSALTLIPVFYGYEPDRLISRSGGKKSFADYYLPYPQSLIVFEYSRYDGNCCVCLYRKNQGGIAYRFLTGSADQTIFSDHLNNLFLEKTSISDILKRGLPFETSNQIDTIIDYKAIIQNDRKTLRKRGKGNRNFTFDASKYALSNTSISHIGALTSVVLKHDRLLAQFKTMVVDSFLRDQISLDSEPIDAKSMDLITDLRSINDFNINTSKLTEAYQKTHQLIQDWTILNDTFEYSQSYSEALIAQQKLIEAELNLKKDLKERTAKDFDNETEAMLKIETTTKIDLDEYLNRIENLNLQKNEWQSKNIAEKKQYVSKIEEYEERIDKKEEIYNALQEDAQAIKNAHAERLRRLSENLTAKIKAINEQKDKIREDTDVEIAPIKDLVNKQIDKSNQKLKAIKEAHLKQYKFLENKKLPINIEIAKAKGGSIDHDSQQSKQRLEEDIDLAHKQLQQLNDEQDKTQETLDNTNKQLIHKQKDVDLINKRYGSLLTKSDDIHKLLYPAKDSLLETLMQQPEHSKNSIMKVLDPELLHRQDLSPEWITDNKDSSQSSLYGLDIALSSIELPNSAIESAELSHQYNFLQNQKSESKNELDTRRKDFESTEIKVRELKASIEIIKEKKKIKNDDIAKIKQQQKQLKIQIKSRQQKLIADKEAELGAIDLKLIKLLEEQKSEIKLFTDNAKHRLQTYEDSISALESQRDNDLDDLNSQIDEAETNKEKDVQYYQDLYQQALEDKGVDTDKLNELDEEIKQLNQQLSRAKSFKKIISEYQRWEREDWSNLDTYKEKAYDLQEIFDEIVKKIEAHHQSKTERIAKINIKIQSLLKHKENLYIQLDDIEQWQNQTNTIRAYQYELEQTPVYKTLVTNAKINKSFDSNFDSNSEYDVIQKSSLVQSELNDAIHIDADTTELTWLTQAFRSTAQNNDETAKLSILSQELSQTISKYSGSKIYDYWQSRQSQYYALKVKAYNIDIEKPIDKDVRHLLDIISLYKLMSDDLNQLKRSINSQFDSIGLHLSNYYYTLKRLNSRVKTIGSDLARKINTEHNFPALTDISIELESKIHTYDMWSDLADFNGQYESWKVAGLDVLPDELFISSFERLLSSLDNTQITEDIESLVRLNISLRENGRFVKIETDRDLQDASSTGLSLLAIIVVFCGMTRYLCPDENVTIHWPLDEIGKLSNQNTKLLFELMEKRNVTLFCAQPDASPILNQFFENKNWLDLKDGVRTINIISSKEANPLLQARHRDSLLNQHV